MDVSGDLKRAAGTPQNGYRRLVVTATQMEIVITLPYAGLHHEGVGDLPVRKIFDPSDSDLDAMAQVIANWVVEGKAKAGAASGGALAGGGPGAGPGA